MPAPPQLNHLGPRDSLAQGAQTAVGNQPIPVADHDQRRDFDSLQLAFHVELLNHSKTMRNNRLIGLPALAGDKMEKRPGPLSTPKEQVEELVDKGIIGR